MQSSSPAVVTFAIDQPGLSTLESAPDAVPALPADDGQMRPAEVFLDYVEAVEPALRAAGSNEEKMDIVDGVIAQILDDYPDHTIAKFGGCRWELINVRPTHPDYEGFELAFAVGRHFYTDGDAVDGENAGMNSLDSRPGIVSDNKNAAALGGRFAKGDGTAHATAYSLQNEGGLYLVIRKGIPGVEKREDFRALHPTAYMRKKGRTMTLRQLGLDKYSQETDKFSLA